MAEYRDERVCLSPGFICLLVLPSYLWNIFLVHVASGHGSAYFWMMSYLHSVQCRCDVMHRVTSLRRRAQDNSRAVSYWLSYVVDDGAWALRLKTSPSCKGCWPPGVEPVMIQ